MYIEGSTAPAVVNAETPPAPASVTLTVFDGGASTVVPSGAHELGWQQLEDLMRGMGAHAPGQVKAARGGYILAKLRRSTSADLKAIVERRFKRGGISQAEVNEAAKHGYRDNAHIESIAALAIDYDGDPTAQPDWRPDAWPGLGFAHSTHGYDPASAPLKWRVLLALKRPVTLAEYKRGARALRLPPHAIIRSPQQPAFFPTCPLGRRVEFVSIPGAPIDWDAVMAAADAMPAPAAGGGWSGETVELGALPSDLIDAVASIVPPIGRRHDFSLVLGNILARSRLSDDDAIAFGTDAMVRGGAEPHEDQFACALQRIRVDKLGGKGWQEFKRLAGGDAARVAAVCARLEDELPGLGVRLTAHRRPLLEAAAAANDGAPAPAEFSVRQPGNYDTSSLPPPLSADATDAELDERRRFWREWFNARFCVLRNEGGKVRVIWVLSSDVDPESSQISLQAKDAFLEGWDNIRDRIGDRDTKKGEIASVPVARWWFASRSRTEALCTTFRPDVDGTFVDAQAQRKLNLWTGFAVEPIWTGAPSARVRRFLRFITKVIAGGNLEYARYIRRWLRWIFQNPGSKAEVALVLRGAKGTGKNTLLDVIRALHGVHGFTATRPEHITGRFNAHMGALKFVFSNEAVPPADKAAESALKGLITDGFSSTERKGIDVVAGQNFVNVAVASNEDWAVPATPGERRFAVFDVSAAHQQDRAYFGALHADIEHEDFKGELLGWLLNTPLPAGWHPRAHVPQTAALADQILSGMRGAQRRVCHMLLSGEPIGRVGTRMNAADGRSVFVATSLFVEASNMRADDVTAVGRELAKCADRQWRKEGRRYEFAGKRHAGYWLPTLEEARANWARETRIKVDWPEAPDWT